MLHSFYKQSSSGLYVVFFSSNDPNTTDTELFKFEMAAHAVEMVSILNGGTPDSVRIRYLLAKVVPEKEEAE